MNDPRIAKLRQMAEKDLRLTDCAMRLYFRICSERVLNPKEEAGARFDLPWKQVAHWCGLTDKMNCYARASELVSAGYLYDEGPRGCPPTNTYKLNLKHADHLAKMVKPGLDGTFKDGVIPSTPRKGNKDAAVRKGLAAMRAATK
jgi:hypothetical protein